MGVYTTVNPATGEQVAEFPELTDEEARDALDRAAGAYPQWRDRGLQERVALVKRIAALHREQREELAALITLEMGKPIVQARGEVDLVANIYDYYADRAEQFLADEVLDISGPGTAIVKTEPVGVLVGIMPWNYPYYQVARFAAPNLILGNTILLKHARNCPQSALAIERVFREAGLPDGVYANVFANNDQIAEMIADPRVQGVSLTGSERAGSAVGEVAGRVRADAELVRVGAPIRAHRHGLAAPDQLGAAPAEPRPPATDQVCGSAGPPSGCRRRGSRRSRPAPRAVAPGASRNRRPPPGRTAGQRRARPGAG